MIAIEQLSKIYHHQNRRVSALQNITLNITDNEIFGVMGRSGSGKSTLLRCMNRLENPSSGRIFFDHIELTTLSKQYLRDKRRSIGMIFQSFNLLNSRNVYENISLPLELIREPSSVIQKKVNQLMEWVGLTDQQSHFPHQLSGGQKQRTAIARALVTNPKWLLCDEPTSALDPESTLNILRLLKRIRRELNVTIVLITHEMNVIKHACDRAAILDNGYLIEEGGVIDMFVNPTQPVTKEFTQHALHLDLPTYLKDALNDQPAPQLSPVVRFAFVGSAANEPVIANLLKRFRVTVNILQADLESIHESLIGFLICKLTGEEENIKKSFIYLDKANVKVEIIGYV
jgi:D-methionine transport system ATP-binding protein